MTDKSVLCYKCLEVINIFSDDYYETGEEETFLLSICPKCKSVNAIYWTREIRFNARLADNEEIEELALEDKKNEKRIKTT